MDNNVAFNIAIVHTSNLGLNVVSLVTSGCRGHNESGTRTGGGASPSVGNILIGPAINVGVERNR